MIHILDIRISSLMSIKNNPDLSHRRGVSTYTTAQVSITSMREVLRIGCDLSSVNSK
jgi:hypothetical protein